MAQSKLKFLKFLFASNDQDEILDVIEYNKFIFNFFGKTVLAIGLWLGVTGAITYPQDTSPSLSEEFQIRSVEQKKLEEVSRAFILSLSLFAAAWVLGKVEKSLTPPEQKKLDL